MAKRYVRILHEVEAIQAKEDNLEENETFQNFVKASKDDFAMTFLIPKSVKFKMEVYLRSHTKKYIASKVVEFVKTLDNERV